ncbi:MAG: helicase [Candidatus Omnitrophica bacterium]|nr:helicase [Candidatus Omnitrophota bacterium]
MPKLQIFRIRIATGEQGRTDIPEFKINGFKIPFDNPRGGVGPGETFEAEGAPQSFAHSLHLCGPTEGTWEIRETTLTYNLMGEPPYTIRLGRVVLDSESDLNIWHERQPVVFDV